MQRMWSHHDPKRILLPLRELREHERVFVVTAMICVPVVGERITCDWYPIKCDWD